GGGDGGGDAGGEAGAAACEEASDERLGVAGERRLAPVVDHLHLRWLPAVQIAVEVGRDDECRADRPRDQRALEGGARRVGAGGGGRGGARLPPLRARRLRMNASALPASGASPRS